MIVNKKPIARLAKRLKPKIYLIETPILCVDDSYDSDIAQLLLIQARIHYVVAEGLFDDRGSGFPSIIDVGGGIHGGYDGVERWIRFILFKREVISDSYIFAYIKR